MSRDAEVEALLAAAERIWMDHLSGYEPGMAAMHNLFTAIPPLRVHIDPCTPPVECAYCHVAIVYRPDDPVMHIGCMIAQDSE